MAAAPKLNQLPKTNPPNRTLADTVAIARAKGDFRQKHSKPLSPAEAEASRHHDRVRGQILDAFREFCNSTCAHLSGVPLKKRFYVLHDERKRLQEKLGEVLRKAGEDYTLAAMAYRSELGSDPLSWVEAQVKTDRDEVTRELLEHWIRQAVGIDASLNLPAWINLRLLARPGRLLSEQGGTIEVVEADFTGVDLAAALPAAEAELVLRDIRAGLCLELGEIVEGMIQSARLKLKLAAVPTTVQVSAPVPQRPRRRSYRKPIQIAIAEIGATYPKGTSRFPIEKICLRMDKKRQTDDKLEVPQPWYEISRSRLWVDNYKCKKTKNRVSRYISDVLHAV